MTWQNEIREELAKMSDLEKFTATGTWITEITQEILPWLGLQRRIVVVDILTRPGWDATRLAETLGTRRTTITRLADEGRSARRRQLAEDPPLPVG